MLVKQNQLITELQRAILPLGSMISPSPERDIRLGLPSVEEMFPSTSFPTGCTHEFLYSSRQDQAATSGFVAGILGKLMASGGICIYISTGRTLFPSSLKRYGIEPHRVIFIDVKNEKDALYATEESLACSRITAVISEIDNISFTQSRRFQLAAEKGHTTGFFLRKQSHTSTNTAAVSKWSISSAASGFRDNLPGVGYPRWYVELVKMRNGRAGKWLIQWSADKFTEVREEMSIVRKENRKRV